MRSFTLLSIILAIGLYVPLCIEIKSGKSTQNLFTWILWALLDGIAAATLFVQYGEYFLVATYSLGSSITSFFIFKSKSKKEWKSFETCITASVIVCVFIWCISGAWWATIASTTAVMAAGSLQLRDSFKKPYETPFWIYLGYTLANVFAVIGAKDWSVEQRLYPFSAGLLCLFITAGAAQQFWKAKPSLSSTEIQPQY